MEMVRTALVATLILSAVRLSSADLSLLRPASDHAFGPCGFPQGVDHGMVSAGGQSGKERFPEFI